MKPKALLQLLSATIAEWSEDKAPQLAAALSFYTVFSLAPLLLIVISVAGLLYGQQNVQTQVLAQIRDLVGNDGAQLIQTMLEGASQRDAGIVATVIGLVSLAFGAAGAFGQIKTALNTIWNVPPKPGPSGLGGILFNLKTQLISFTMVLGTGFLLLVSLVISAVLTALNDYFGARLPIPVAVWQVINFLVSFGVITLLFALIYRVLPDIYIAWSDVWLGAAITALLFTIGKFLIGLYLGHSSVASSYGAAGSLIILLLWINYSAQILFLGAEFTQVYASTYGSLAKAKAAANDPKVVAQQYRPEPTVKPQESSQRPSVLARVSKIAVALSPIALIGMRLWIQWSEARDRLSLRDRR
ncbi:MAG: YihY/virulence factor BrkB family protein [Anaerolineae bacterium]|nr:YihY/virulence factor BrkB family protein [Anaerolineae bacterium]